MSARQGLRVVACGGRTFEDAGYVADRLTFVHSHTPIALLIQGGARGVDAAAAAWALVHGVECVTVSADWEAFGRAAGPIRNQRMIDEHRPQLCLAFPGGRGTADLLRRARAAGIGIVKFAPPPAQGRTSTALPTASDTAP